MVPDLESQHSSLMVRVTFHAQTLWLFTFSDLKTIVIPSTIFGIINALASSFFGIPSTGTDPIRRLPLIFLWVWAHLLPFAINNQRAPLSIIEDLVNKPWRPIPQGRISPSQARVLMLCLYATTPLISTLLAGGLRQSVALIFLGTWYNNFGGADRHPIMRNAINALGYLCFASGAMEVSLASPLPINFSGSGSGSGLLQWLGIIAGIIITTVHTQDMYDQEGDALRGRRTLPIVVGDACARYITALSVALWGICCPTFWGAAPGSMAFIVSFGFAIIVVIRTLMCRDVPNDKLTFLVWNIWVSTVFILPICSPSRRV
ncbi:UbiA prenyltransferase family-domain-containing protein [Annulohypoxylon maeteangense]|uniref:UbiA prenyltransferase family-domain-containing protein n=1 Tax=Annulohypoxylon maeteangense TaxID=1927788 RepID=UPI002008432E|nr:UbiA prenyltransferase family-domain-containing protein [Annulohypoxylon maeteangense]KAI0885723.1 UbiA prenyltransferase family-domain-containing protein [Annulohypoxylon maeteangense]